MLFIESLFMGAFHILCHALLKKVLLQGEVDDSRGYISPRMWLYKQGLT